MNIIKGNLTIRDATLADAEQLCKWWNDGAVMAHAGFPNGLGTTVGEIRASLATDTDDTHRRHIIELDGRPIGEMNYRNKGGGVAEIGIKICDFTEQEKGRFGKIAERNNRGDGLYGTIRGILDRGKKTGHRAKNHV